jgi:hypothetical protein
MKDKLSLPFKLIASTNTDITYRNLRFSIGVSILSKMRCFLRGIAATSTPKVTLPPFRRRKERTPAMATQGGHKRGRRDNRVKKGSDQAFSQRGSDWSH